MSLHHTKAFVDAHVAERHAVARRRRAAADPAGMEALLRSARNGDHDAWAAIVRRFAPRIRAVARSHRLDSHAAEDVVQQTLLRLLTRGDQVRDAAALGAWLETIARRESLNLIAAARRHDVVEPSQLPELPEPERVDPVEAEERAAALMRAIAALPARARDIMRVLLRDPAPSYADVAAELDLPVGSIGPTRARSLERLREDGRLVRAVQE